MLFLLFISGQFKWLFDIVNGFFLLIFIGPIVAVLGLRFWYNFNVVQGKCPTCGAPVQTPFQSAHRPPTASPCGSRADPCFASCRWRPCCCCSCLSARATARDTLPQYIPVISEIGETSISRAVALAGETAERTRRRHGRWWWSRAARGCAAPARRRWCSRTARSPASAPSTPARCALAVHACVRVRARARVRACVRACVCVCVPVCVRACILARYYQGRQLSVSAGGGRASAPPGTDPVRVTSSESRCSSESPLPSHFRVASSESRSRGEPGRRGSVDLYADIGRLGYGWTGRLG